jgi:hypothetical protein
LDRFNQLGQTALPTYLTKQYGQRQQQQQKSLKLMRTELQFIKISYHITSRLATLVW